VDNPCASKLYSISDYSYFGLVLISHDETVVFCFQRSAASSPSAPVLSITHLLSNVQLPMASKSVNESVNGNLDSRKSPQIKAKLIAKLLFVD